MKPPVKIAQTVSGAYYIAEGCILLGHGVHGWVMVSETVGDRRSAECLLRCHRRRVNAEWAAWSRA